MAKDTNWNALGSDVYHRPEPTTDCPSFDLNTPAVPVNAAELERWIQTLFVQNEDGSYDRVRKHQLEPRHTHYWDDDRAVWVPVVEMKDPEPWGFQVRVQFQDSAGRRERTFHNVTEIHFRYPPAGERVAFESDIHSTGQTYQVEDILEFESRLEPRLAEEF